MRLLELFEADNSHVTFCFGRMNPPTIGHEQVFKTMASQGGDYKIFVSQTQDKKENPLSYSEKINFIKAIHPNYADNLVENTALNTIGKVASYLYDQGYRNATFVAGSDRLESFKKLLTDYNGVEGKAHGFYKFDVLDFVSSGERDPDSPGISGVSASKARAAAANNDLEGFQEATGAGEYSKPMFDAVRKGMGIKEMQEANPNQQISLYKPDGKTYRQEIMPTLDNDPVDNADSLDVLKNEPYETDFSKEEIKRIILKHLENLNDREKKILKARYWLEMTLDEISEAMKVSRERIRQIEAKAMRKLRLSFSKSKEYDFEHMSEGYGRYYCSTDKKWKTRKGPKQKRS
jgi:RNA polymerase sigma factor (sigma-70 family)